MVLHLHTPAIFHKRGTILVVRTQEACTAMLHHHLWELSLYTVRTRVRLLKAVMALLLVGMAGSKDGKAAPSK